MSAWAGILDMLAPRRSTKRRRARSRGGVYILRVEVGGATAYKVGKADRFAERLSTHERSVRAARTLCPVPFEARLVGRVPADDPARLERQLHRRFAADRVRGIPARELYWRTPGGPLDRWLADRGW